MIVNQLPTNLARACKAWGEPLPRWMRLLAEACDKANQRAVADQISAAGFACSSGTVSKLINNKYPASPAEAEKAVLAVFGGDEVNCPLYGPIPLQSCIRARRRKTPARNSLHLRFDETCPDCPNNTDGGEA